MLQNETPLVGVAPTKLIKGIRDFDDIAEPLKCISLKEALETQWNTDAHFFTYQPEGHETWPRLNSEVLPKLEKNSVRLLKNCIVLDYDNPEHKPWNGEFFSAFLEKFNNLSQNPILSSWVAFYTTSGGCRFVYVPEKIESVSSVDASVRCLIRDFAIYGLEIDITCAQWTRCFRLPRVLRDDVPTWTQSYFLCEYQWESRLDVLKLLPFGKVDVKEVPHSNEEKPATAYSLSLLKNTDGSETDWFRKAKKKLKNKNCFDIIFRDQLIAEQGERDVKIQSYVGEAISALFPIEGTTVKLIYALFLPAISELHPDPQTPDWTTVLWRSCLRYWASELAKAKERQLELEISKQEAVSVARRIIETMQTWCSAPELKDADYKAREWLQSKLIAATLNHYYLMTPEGYYDTIPVTMGRLPSRIRELGMQSLIPLWVPKKDGTFRPKSGQEIIDSCVTSVGGLEGASSIEGSFIRSIGKKDSTLIQRLYGLKKDFKGEYNVYVDTWLKLMAGPNFDTLQHWIAWALDFEAGPICALSITGPPGLGKKMLVWGLAENIDTETVADATEMGRFKSLLVKSPFVVVNEGFPKIEGRDAADTFRQLVSGDPIAVEQKFRDTIIVRNPVRMIFTANNDDVVHMLSLNKDMSPYDREALAIRLFHFNAPVDASLWLAQQGGLAFTDGWIKSDAGGPSKYIVAKHFKWLYEQRRLFPRGGRLLVEGEVNNETIRIISPRGGKAPEIVEALINLVESTPEAGDPNGRVFIKNNQEIWVTTSGVQKFWRETIGKYSKRDVSTIDIGKVLRGFWHKEYKDYPIVIKYYANCPPKAARWRRIDPSLLYQEAVQHGYNCKRIEALHHAEMVTQTNAIIQATEDGTILPPIPKAI